MTILVYRHFAGELRWGRLRLTLSSQDQVAHDKLAGVPSWQLEQALDACLAAIIQRA